MNHSRALVTITTVLVLLFSASTGFALFTLYKSLTGVSIRGRTDMQTAVLLTQMKEKLRDAKTIKDAEHALKSLDGIPASVLSPEKSAELKKIYSSNQGASKDVSFDLANFNRIKSEAVTVIFNFYRQQVVRRNLNVAALLSGVISDAHSSLLRDQKSDVHQSFIRKAREEIESIPVLASGLNDQREILDRVESTKNILNQLSSAVKQQLQWEKERDQIYQNAEQIIASMLTEISARLDRNIDSLQRDFLIAAFLALLAIVLAFWVMQATRARVRSWFSIRLDHINRLLGGFGRVEDQGPVVDTTLLKNDPDWNVLLSEIQRAEQGFRARSAAETALSKCFSIPFVVFSQTKKAVYWNSFASRSLDISSRDEIDELSFEEFFSRCIIIRRKENLPEVLRKIGEGKEVCLQFHRRSSAEVIPVEVTIYPLQGGALKGGFVVVFRDMKDEEKRISESLNQNYKVVDNMLDIISVDGAPDLAKIAAVEADLEQVPEQVLPVVDKLRRLRVRIDERESLWKSEIQAVWDQVKREEEVLARLSKELDNVRAEQEGLVSLAKVAADSERKLRDLHGELGRRVEEGHSRWKSVSLDIEAKTKLAERAYAYEQSVRDLVNEMADWKSSFQAGLISVRKCKDWVRLHAMNLNLTGAQDLDTFRDRARKFSIAMSEFYERLEKVEKELQVFIERHPGSSPVTMLDGGNDIRPMMEALSKAYEALEDDVSNWKTANEEIQELTTQLDHMTTASMEKKKEIDLLKDASIQLNGNALKALERWV